MKFKLIYIIAFTQFLYSQSYDTAKNDSIFKKFSIDNILRFKSTLSNRVDKNTVKKEQLGAVGLQVNKSILESNSSIGTNQDVMLLRLAEFYIDEADRKYFEAYDGYDKKLEEYLNALDKFEEDPDNNEKPVELVEPVRDYSKPLSMYDKIINEYGDGESVDDALYEKAFLLLQAEQGAKARRTFQELIDKFPDSRFTPHALMSLADYYFYSEEDKDEEDRLEDLRRSILMFKKVLRYKDFERYDEALYRLGWAYYKMAARDAVYYKDAIAYFTLVLDDIYKGMETSIGAKYTNINIKDEAIQYIGVSFSSEDNPKGGVRNLKRYVQKLVSLDKKFAPEVMKSLGDVYYEVRESEKIIEAYTAFQELFPYHRLSAKIQDRIVSAYRQIDNQNDLPYESDYESFNERYKIFTKYNSKSDWYNQVLALNIENKFDILNEAERNAETALRTNIVLLFKDIGDKERDGVDATADYQSLITMCEEYLEFFPNMDNAFLVHKSLAFILDDKMKQYKRAYEEYIEASNNYPSANLNDIKDVAYNAIVVADSLRRMAGDDKIQFEYNPNDTVKAEVLTETENRLVESYENYIRISPNDSNAAKFLANLGAIYFNRKQFGEANKYAKTLLARFPGAKGEALARQQILNGYYARGQFLSAEALAKKVILDPNSDPGHKEEARKRFFDSILKNAKFYEDQSRHFIAGYEYRRAAVQSPFETRKDLRLIALYNSGIQFEAAEEYEEAIESYSLIVDENKINNVYTKNAMKNIAKDYFDLKQFTIAAEYYEKLYVTYPDSADAKQNLLNASTLYEQEALWLDAIRVNDLFAVNFPADEDAKDLLFNNANHYLKLDDFDNANDIYNRFTAAYPDDPRTIEAHYKKGIYYLEKENINDAKDEFQSAITRNERFENESKKTDAYHASESAYEIIQIDEKEFRNIVFNWPASNIAAKREDKKAMMNKMVENYQRLMKYGSARSIEAPYKIAELTEHFATTIANQQTDPNEKNAAKLIQAEGQIRATATNVYEQAISNYKKAITDIKKIADKLNINLDEVEPAKVEEDSAASDIMSLKKTATINLDSLKSTALNFIDLSKEKVTAIVFLIAKQSEENIKNVLNFKSEYDGKLGQEPLALQFRDAALQKSVVIQVQKSIDAHRRNLIESQELNIINKYTEESKRQIIVNSNIVANEYNKLKQQSLDLFVLYYKEFVKLIPKNYGTKSSRLKKAYFDIGPDLALYLDYATDYNTKALNGYIETIKNAREDSITNDLSEFTELSVLKGPYEYVSILEAYQDSIKTKRNFFKRKFNELEPKGEEVAYNYQDGSDELEGVEFSLSDNALAGLDDAYQYSLDMDLPRTPTFNKILKKLVLKDPVTYSEGIPKNEIVIKSDETWKVSKDYENGLNSINYNDSTWISPLIVSNDTITIEAFDTLDVDVKSLWYAENVYTEDVIDSNSIINLPKTFLDTLTNETVQYYDMDTLGNPIALEIDSASNLPIGFIPEYEIKTVQFTTDTVDTTIVYFRKAFEITGKLHSAKYFGTGDGLTDLFINNELITTFENEPFKMVDVGDHTLFADYLKKDSKNMISIWTTDLSKPRFGMMFYLKLYVLPPEFSSNEEIVVDETTKLNDDENKRIQTYIKARIIPKPVNSSSNPNQNEVDSNDGENSPNNENNDTNNNEQIEEVDN